jgi:hypothetical protein
MPMLAGLDKFFGPWKFLTFWNMWVQLIYFSICLVNDFTGGRKSANNNKSGKQGRGFLERAEDYLFASIAFPMGLFVGIAFWGLYAFNRELVYPAVLDKIVPVWLNHAMHTTYVISKLTLPESSLQLQQPLAVN